MARMQREPAGSGTADDMIRNFNSTQEGRKKKEEQEKSAFKY